MRRNLLLALIVLVFVAIAGLSGCKSKEEKACAHMKDLMEEAISSLPAEAQEQARTSEMGEFDQECAEHTSEMKERCSNADDVFDCFINAENMDAAENCDDLCQAAEGTH